MFEVTYSDPNEFSFIFTRSGYLNLALSSIPTFPSMQYKTFLGSKAKGLISS